MKGKEKQMNAFRGNIKTMIKTHGIESRGQEGTKCMLQQQNVTTTVSHLHDGMVLQFLEMLCHIL